MRRTEGQEVIPAPFFRAPGGAISRGGTVFGFTLDKYLPVNYNCFIRLQKHRTVIRSQPAGGIIKRETDFTI